MGFKVEGVTEASLTADVFVACLFQHSCRGLAGHSPSALSEGVRKLREPQRQNRQKGQGRGRGRVGPEVLPAAQCESLEPGTRLEFHVGWSGWTRPPTMGRGGGGGGGGRERGGLQSGVERAFKGSKHPEAG